jgi:hypothetical protein
MAAVAVRAGRAGEDLRPVANDRLEIRSDAHKGRGLFARAPIAAGAVIEAAPVIVVPTAECALLDQTILHDYYFHWDADGAACGAVALGLLALCNHSRRPRARVRPNYARETLDLVALAPIAAGEEITIDYDCPLWFVPQD